MSQEKHQGKRSTLIEIVFLVCTIGILLIILIAPIDPIANLSRQKENASAAWAHNLDIAMFSYANDNDGKYPSEPTSTAIFQLLFDGKYLQQSGDVFLALNGKVRYPNETVKGLQSQNVSWDVVEHADGTGLNNDKDPGEVPVVFSTGLGAYTFVDGSNPVKIDQPDQAAWGQDGVTIAYLNQEARFVRPTSASDATVKLTKLDFKTGVGSYKSVQP